MNQNYSNFRANNPSYIPNQSTYPPYMNIPNENTSTSTIPAPQYAENLFERNIGKKVTAYFSYPDSVEWRDKTFSGIIKSAGRDYVLLKNDQNQTILLWLIYINYAIFEEEISY